MTRKDYQLIAASFADWRRNVGAQLTSNAASDMARATFDQLASNVADRLAEDNHKFDRGRFLRACRGQ